MAFLESPFEKVYQRGDSIALAVLGRNISFPSNSGYVHSSNMGRIKQKGAFEDAQNAQNQIILLMYKVSSRAQLFKTNDVVS